MQQIVSRGVGVQTISARTPEEAITNITTCLMETKNKTDNILNEYNSAEVRYPISILSSLLGKDCIEICEFLALGNSEKIRNNQKPPIDNGNVTYVLSFDAIVNLANAGLEKMLHEGVDVICSRQVKNHLLSEIRETIYDLSSKASKGTMYLVNDRAIFSERTLELKRNRFAFLASIKNIIASLSDVEAFDFETPNSDMDALFSKRKMDIESSTLAVLQNIKNAVLVTDDQFLYAVTEMLGYKSVGICGFLAGICEDSTQLIEISKKLKSINYANYLPVFLFDKIVNYLNNYKTTEEIEKATHELTKWLLSDRGDEEATDYHREVILQLYRDCTQQVGHIFSREHALTQIAIYHFKMLNPKYIKQLVEDLT
jgi:hypothetical protein